MDYDKEDKQTRIRRLLSIALKCPANVARMSSAELDLTLRVIRRVRLHGRLAAKLKEAGVFDELPSTARDQLDSALVMAESRTRLAKWELNRIAWALEDNSAVPLVVMKGCAYLLLDLPNSPGRIFADVDLLLPEDELELVEAALNQRGWYTQKLSPYDQNYYRKWTHELPPLIHAEREVEIDLHHNVIPRTARLHPSSKKLLDQSRLLPNSRYRVLADEDIVLHAITHLMFDGDLADKLRDLIDISDLIVHFSTRACDFWEKFVDRAVELDLARPAYYGIRYARMFLDVPVPERVIESSNNWAPPRFIVMLMDRLVPRALYPQHPDHPSRSTELCRLLLYMYARTGSACRPGCSPTI